MLIALILLIIFALIVLTGFILALVAGIRPAPRFKFRLPFPKAPGNDLFSLLRLLTQKNILWHPGQGDLPDPPGDTSVPEIHDQPME